MKARRHATFVAVLAAMALVAAACGGGGQPEQTEEQPDAEQQTGGEIVLGAEQWPECTNPITTCAAASWAFWSVFWHVLPRLTEVDLEGNYSVNPGTVAAELPTVENGLITEDPPTIEVPLNPDAVWEDGSQISCEDIRFTSLAQQFTKGSYSAGSGYDQITEIDCSQENTAILHLAKPLANWNDLFGGALSFIIKAGAYPDADPDEPDISEETNDALPYSGGPWLLDSWSKRELVLVPNENYWWDERKPLLDQVTMIPITEQAAEINAILSREVAAIFPQPSEVSIPDQVAEDPAVQVTGQPGTFNEEIWIQNQNPPMDDPDVRLALAHALDREAVMDAIIRVNQPDAEVLNCPGTVLAHVGDWCTPVFEDITYDPERSIEILEGAGWDCSAVPESPCEKDGEPLSILYSTVAGNTRREATQQLLKERARPAGFDFRVKNYDAGVLFGDIGPKGEFHIADYAIGPVVDPSFTANFHCDNIPSEENEFAGGNWSQWCNQEASELMDSSDSLFDTAERQEQITRIQELYREDVASVPLYALPNVIVWRTDQVEGPVDEYAAHAYSAFFNIFDWSVPA